MRSWGVLILYSCQQDQSEPPVANKIRAAKGRRAPWGGRGEAPPAGGGASYRLRGPLRPSSPAGLPSRGRSSPISDLRLETRPRIGQLPKPPLPGKRPRLSQEQPPWTSADPGTWGRGRLEDLVWVGRFLGPALLSCCGLGDRGFPPAPVPGGWNGPRGVAYSAAVRVLRRVGRILVAEQDTRPIARRALLALEPRLCGGSAVDMDGLCLPRATTPSAGFGCTSAIAGAWR